MRLRFSLKNIKIDPVCHIQINRHAEQYQGKSVTGLLYGALYQDQGHITNILPFPQSQTLQARQDTIIMQKRHDQSVNQFHLDDQCLGFYYISYSGDYWQQLENVKLFEDYKNTSFFIIYDYQARQLGKNPYKGFRLTDQFFNLLSTRSWQSLKKAAQNKDDPFAQIPVQIQKNQLFELMMLYNKKSMLKKFITKKQSDKNPQNLFHQKIKNYIQVLTEQNDNIKKIADCKKKSQNPDVQSQKVPDDCFYHTIAIQQKAKSTEKYLRNYQNNLQVIQKDLV